MGDLHYVRDGHHRVSVARDHQAPTIDADVVELRRLGAPIGTHTFRLEDRRGS